MTAVMPLLVMDGILLVVTVLLAVADKLLVSYGECTIRVSKDEETSEFTVSGGMYLHTALSENGVSISSSCGGKATCGYCKVKVASGGGPMLPTEEVFMSRQEKREGMRLACQVKVKEDLEVVIPDFLETVRNMVENGTFDSKILWRVKVDQQVPEMLKKGKLPIELIDSDTRLNAVVETFAEKGGSAVPVLQEANAHYRYLPEDFMRYLSEKSDMPLSSLFRLASFYNAFSLDPRGKFVLTVCTGTACHVKGAGRLVALLEEELKVAREHTTEDLQFTLKTVRCVGCCGLAPVIIVGDQVMGSMDAAKTLKLVDEYRSK